MAEYFTHLAFAVQCSQEDADRVLATHAFLEELAAGRAPSADQPLHDNVASCFPSVATSGHMPSGEAALSRLRACFSDPDDPDLGVRIVYQAREERLWIEDREGLPDIKALAEMLRRLIPARLPIGFQFAYGCTEHRADAFGGGACVIVADRVLIRETSQVEIELLEETHRSDGVDDAAPAGERPAIGCPPALEPPPAQDAQQ